MSVKLPDGILTKYIYDGVNILLEYDGANVLQARFTPEMAIDQHLLMNRSGVHYFYQADGLGSVTELTDDVGNIVQSYVYDSFGNASVFDQNGAIISIENGIVNPFTYTGREFDAETGLYYYRARYYDSKVGRFISEDPTGFNSSVNLYIYGLNNPIIFLDPSGLYAEIQCTRCGQSGPISCSVFEDGQPTDFDFRTNTGKNDPSRDKRDPYGENGPLPPGDFDITIDYSPKFKRFLPTPSNTGVPGRIVTPKGSIRTGVRIHAGTHSQGCFTCGSGQSGKALENKIIDTVAAHESSGGTILTLEEKDCCGG